MVGLTRAIFAHKSNVILIFAIIGSLIVVVTSSMREPPGFDKFDKIRVNEKNFDKIKNLHVNWYAFSIKALMGQLGRELFKQLSKEEKRQLSDCLDDIDDTKDLVLAAKCLVSTRTAYMKRKAVIEIERFLTSEISHGTSTDLQKNSSAVITINTGIGDAKNSKDRNILFSDSGIEDSRRASRIELKSKTLQKADLLKNLQTKSGSARITPESKVKDEDYTKPDVIHTSNSLSQENVMWHKYRSKETVNPRFRRKIDDTYSSSPPKRPMFAYSRYQTRDHNGKVADENTWQVKQSDSVPTLSSISDKSPVARVAGLISNFAKDILPSPGHVPELVNDDGSKLKWSEMYNKLLKIKQQNDAKKKSPGAKVYDLRMYDLVLGHESPTVSTKKRFTPEGILQTGLNLIDQISGPESAKVRQGSNSKWLSPRFAPLMPDKTETDPNSAHLSPTLFALYETPENDATNIASVPKILKGTGMNKKDRETVIETLMDITGTTDHVNDALGLLSKGTDFLGINGEIFDANDRISSAYQKLENSFNVDQSNQIDNNGFAFLEEAQLTDLFRDQRNCGEVGPEESYEECSLSQSAGLPSEFFKEDPLCLRDRSDFADQR
ncbi:moulting cycle domain-containing protein [Ditylenchus destructor]|nr:moulting cycle domain-containing protein [Ditylenchus destructor]